MEFLRPFRKTGELNQVERWKLARHPLEVHQAVLDVYARDGPEAIDAVPGEWERLKWVGLYPQVQGGDAFMLRIKVPGGRLAADQARAIGEIAQMFARGPDPNPPFGEGVADITTRQDVQLHWISVRQVPEIWRRLEAVGITTVQACGDSARNVVCCPVSGIDREEVIEAYPVARAISEFFTGNREFANLPRKWKQSVTGCRENCAQAEINDVGLWPARAADGSLGFNVLVGGGLSDRPRMASDIDVFVRPDQAVDLARAIARVYGELGNMGSPDGWSSVLVRTPAGRDAFAWVRDRLELRPLEEPDRLLRLQAMDRRIALQSLRSPLDPDGPLFIDFEEHAAGYARSDRAPVRIAR